MGKIYIETKAESISKDGFEYEVRTKVDATIHEAMVGIATVVCDIENSLPDEDRQQFRCDFISILGKTRRGELNA